MLVHSPTTQSRAQLFTLELDRGLDWPKALAELQAANAREAAAGNTDTINGFYQSRYDGEMGRRHQHLIIAGAALIACSDVTAIGYLL